MSRPASRATATSMPTRPLDQLRRQVRDFANGEVAPRVARMERDQTVDMTLPDLLARQGWLGATIPASHGGLDLGHTAKTIIVEELSRVSGAAGAIVQASQLGAAKIVHFGDQAKQSQWLRPIAQGLVLPTIAVTEEGSGSHVLGMRSSARRRGRGWILTGAKVFIGNSHVGHVHGVVVRTGQGTRGLTAFLVEADRAGVSLAWHRPLLGLHGFSCDTVHFADVRVPDTHRIGEVGDGLAVAYSSSVLYGRPQLAAVALGLHTALLEQTVAFTQTRHRYGRPLADLDTIKNKVGALVAAERTARGALYAAVRRLDIGEPCDTDLIHAKLINVELLLDSARIAMDIHGAAGLDATSPISRILRDAYCLSAPAGTSDIQRLRLAQGALTRDHPRHTEWSTRFPGHWAHLHVPASRRIETAAEPGDRGEPAAVRT